MNPEQQKLLRERYNLHRQQLKNEAEAALRQSGLRLDQSAHDQFEARYLQERRKIERELREQFEATNPLATSAINRSFCQFIVLPPKHLTLFKTRSFYILFRLFRPLDVSLKIWSNR